MGGFFGATSFGDVVPEVMERLGSMAPAACNSSGIAVLARRRIQRYRIGAPLCELEQLMSAAPATASTAIAHAEQTTSARSSRRNAQPHASSRVAVVHAGTIMNHENVRRELESQGVQFRSESESEVIVWLLDRALASRARPQEALSEVLGRLRGPLALAVICSHYDKRIFATQRGGALVFGRTEQATWLSSEPQARLPSSTARIPLRDGEIVELRPDGVRALDLALRPRELSWRASASSSRVFQ